MNAIGPGVTAGDAGLEVPCQPATNLPSGALRATRIASRLVPFALAVYAVTYGILSGSDRVHTLATLVAVLASAAALSLFRREPAVPIASAMLCWSFTGSAVFVIAVSFLLARRQPRLWWAWLAVAALLFPLGLVPPPQYFEAGFALLPLAIVPIYAAIAPALAGLLTRSAVRASHLELTIAQARAEAAENAARMTAEHARAVRAEERLRISRDVHDIAGAQLSRVVLQAAAIESTTTEPVTSALARSMQRSAREAIEDLHIALGLLRGRPVAEVPKQTPTDVIRNAVSNGQKIAADGASALDGLPPAVLSIVTAGVTETLHNAAKYAVGGPIQVTFTRTPEAVCVETTNAPGHRQAGLPTGGFGLHGMRERIEKLDGTMRFGPREDGGFTVAMCVPVPT